MRTGSTANGIIAKVVGAVLHPRGLGFTSELNCCLSLVMTER